MSDWISVSSSAISAIKYKRYTLTIWFNNDSIYEYYHVTPIIFDDFVHAPSKGIYFQEIIRDQYPYKRIDKK